MVQEKYNAVRECQIRTHAGQPGTKTPQIPHLCPELSIQQSDLHFLVQYSERLRADQLIHGDCCSSTGGEWWQVLGRYIETPLIAQLYFKRADSNNQEL